MGDEQSDRTDSKTTLLGRRDALKVLGGTALAGLAVGSASAQTDSETETFVVDASDATWSYRIETTGTVARVPTDATVDDSITDGTVEGTASNGLAAYELTGDVTALSLDGPASVSFGPDAGGQLAERHSIAIASPTEVSYTLTTTGEITKRTDASDLSAEATNDTVTQNDDGTWTVTGYTGNGYGDAYEFLGSVVGFSPMDGDVSITYDGNEVTTYELTGQQAPPRTLAVVSQSEVAYEFTVDGSVETVFDAGRRSAESTNDTVTDNGDGTWTVSGYTGNGYGDSYAVQEDVTAFSPTDGDYTLYLDGDAVTCDDLLSSGTTDTSDSTTPVIGGGDGYADTVSPDAATRTVTTVTELADALAGATSGDVVYVDGSAELDLGETGLTVPSGVTLASDRGVDGAAGGHLYTSTGTWPLLSVERDARVTGLRISGPSDSYREYDSSAVHMGVRVVGSGVEVDNNEVWGFSHAAIRTDDDTHVHHNDVHHNSMAGLGYEVSVVTGRPTVEYNAFDYNRHGIAGSGASGFLARYNHFGPATIDHVVGVQEPGGTSIEIHHNTFEAVTHVQDSGTPESVAISGIPSDVADVHGNWFYNPDEPGATPGGYDGSAITQVGTDDWANLTFASNHYGSSEPAPDVGCPR